MDLDEIRRLRLYNQQILSASCTTPASVVAHLGAMQAQEYAMAKWAVGLRLNTGTEAAVEAALQSGRLLRTHLLRPTWHFVTPEDIRWILELTAPQVHKANGTMYRKTGLSTEILAQASQVIEKALSKEGQLTRAQLARHVEHAGISATGHRLAYIMMFAELEGLICSGARVGKQFSYALLDTLVPPAESLSRPEALAKLAERYFISRGPATVRDFATWSGLTLTDARLGVSLLCTRFSKVAFNDQEYFFIEPPASPVLNERATFLLPDYDEYGMSYKDRSALAPLRRPKETPSDYSHWLIVRGRIEGVWQPAPKQVETPTVVPYYRLESSEKHEVKQAQARYQAFWTRSV